MTTTTTTTTAATAKALNALACKTMTYIVEADGFYGDEGVRVVVQKSGANCVFFINGSHFDTGLTFDEVVAIALNPRKLWRLAKRMAAAYEEQVSLPCAVEAAASQEEDLTLDMEEGIELTTEYVSKYYGTYDEVCFLMKRVNGTPESYPLTCAYLTACENGCSEIKRYNW